MNRKGGSPDQMRAIAKKRRGPSIRRLASVGRVAIEVGRIYRHAPRKEIDTIEAYRLASVLGVMAKCLEQSQLEARFDELEKALLAREQPFSPEDRIVSNNAILKRIEKLEQELASNRRPQFVVCFGEKHSEQRQKELGREYTVVTLRRPSWVATDDEWQQMMSCPEQRVG